MKTYRETLTLNIPEQMAFVNITPQIEAAVKKSGVRDGLALVNTINPQNNNATRPTNGRPVLQGER